MNKTPVLTKKDINKAALRWMGMAVNTYTYQYQQAGSIVYSLGPALRKIYDNDDEYVASLNNHFNYFNTHPWMASMVLGAVLGIEDEGGIEAKEAVQSFKIGLMGPMAGIGDSLIWVLYPTIMGSIAGYMALEGNMLSLIHILKPQLDDSVYNHTYCFDKHCIDSYHYIYHRDRKSVV